MSSPIDPKLKQILQSLAAKKPGQVQELLAEACANDESLMDKLQAIMSDSDIQTLHQATEQDIADWQDLEATITPGEMIGPYKVAHQIGEGGMGVVVKAEQQQPIQRTVAVKIIKQGMSSRQVLRRFQMEQQTLGNMNHPYIAQVYDAGVTDNKRPYFVMEYIEGTPLTQFCDDQKLDLHERLNLFDKVCDGIRYAHQRGIVHRDLKPANILVFESEGKFIPKIIDFGIAKALHTSPEAGQTMLTAWGTTMGSPGYMSPEQARTNEVEIDTRTDVYALGVILYELATGFLPISPDQWYIKSLDEMLDIIINKPAPKPSELLKDSKDQLAEILPNRATTYPKLHRAIKGDLDWIILKAVEKEQNRRYSTAAELQNDVDNYLKGMPVLAGPPGVGYQLKKFVSRNKLPVAAFSLFMLALIGGIVGTTQGFLEAKKEQKSTQQTLDLLQEFLVSPKPGNQGRDLKVTELLYTFTGKLDSQDTDPAVRASLYNTIGSTYISLGIYDQAQTYLEKSQQLIRTQGLRFSDTYWKVEANIALLHKINRRLDEAIDLYKILIAQSITENGPMHRRTFIFKQGLADVHVKANRADEAAIIYTEILKHEDLIKREYTEFHTALLYNYSIVLSSQGDFEKTLEIQNQLLDTYTNKYGPDHAKTISLKQNIANTYYSIGDRQKTAEIEREALASARIAFGPKHPETISILRNYAVTNYQLKNYEIAAEMMHEAWQAHITIFGKSNPDTLSTQKNLARVYLDSGSAEKSLPILDEIIALSEPTNGADHIVTIDAYRLRALALMALNENIAAKQILQKQLAIGLEHLGPTHRLKLAVQEDLAHCLRRTDGKVAFVKAFLQVQQLYRERFGPSARLTLSVLFGTLQKAMDDNDTEAALELAQQVKAVYQATYGKDSEEINKLLKRINPLFETETL